jgi:hypothetical protein
VAKTHFQTNLVKISWIPKFQKKKKKKNPNFFSHIVFSRENGKKKKKKKKKPTNEHVTIIYKKFNNDVYFVLVLHPYVQTFPMSFQTYL